jgi:hypothetical protein
MTDEKHYKLLEEFGNDHSIAKGGGIVVKCSAGYTSMTPVDKDCGCKYEDGNLLHDQLNGASSFLFWLRRKGYDIVQRKANIKKG